MKYKLKHLFLYGALIILIASASYVVIYYFTANEINQLRTLSPGFLTVVMVYIAVQLIKRYFQKETPWYNYLYYIGLIAVIIPLPLFSLQGDWIFSVTKAGSFFLLLPPVIELFVLNKKKQKYNKNHI